MNMMNIQKTYDWLSNSRRQDRSPCHIGIPLEIEPSAVVHYFFCRQAGLSFVFISFVFLGENNHIMSHTVY